MKDENVIIYDYKTVRVRREMEEMLTDAYRNLGWEVTNTMMADASLRDVNISFKRNRKIINKNELNNMQEKIDLSLNNIRRLQSAKRNAGLKEALTVGTIGVLTFGGGMSMVMCRSGIDFLIGGIAIGVVGIGIGLLGWLTHTRLQKKKLKSLNPVLENEFDNLSNLCEEANKLLNRE